LTTDILLSLAQERLLSPKWSADVLEEVKRNRPDGVTAERIDARFAQMNKVFPAAMTSGYDGLIANMPADDKDKHVLAAAVHSRSSVRSPCWLPCKRCSDATAASRAPCRSFSTRWQPGPT
jgi:hypothetical protein